MLGHGLFEGLGLQPAGETAVAVVALRLGLRARHADLVRVDDDHEVAGVDVRRVLRLVLALENLSGLGSDATENLVLSVDQDPFALNFVGLRVIRLHYLPPKILSYPAVRGGSPSPVGGSNDNGPTAMRRMIGFKSAGRSDAGFLRRRTILGLDSLARASASHCMHGAFESEPLHCIRVFRQKSTEILHVARDLHKESEVPKPPKPRQRTNVSRETFDFSTHLFLCF